ncbi:hypothetical protein [Pseudotenacibaculum haliotis]|uniref:Uncharacterized protein n=1 Tax=Pseudotenacibaculum haliotis TaxID=1862138 RepID=A0ABW5LPJ3_9FLAO
MKIITKQEAEVKAQECIAWLAYADEVHRNRKLKEAQRNYWLGKLVHMDEYGLDKMTING